MSRIENSILGLLVFASVSCGGPDLPKSVEMAYEKLPEKLDFNLHVKPILSDKCFICHGPDKAKVKAGLQLHLPELAYSELKDNPGKYAVKPGNLSKSETVSRILSDDLELVMPKPESHLTLTDYEKAMLVRWIDEGAEYKDHWAFLPPENIEPPLTPLIILFWQSWKKKDSTLLQKPTKKSCCED